MTEISFSLITAVTAQVSCQILKTIIYSVKEGRFTIKYGFSAGGFPSSHSAFVTALVITIGIRNGFLSDIFAVAFVFAAIVIFDAYRLRGAVQKQSEIINKLLKKMSPEDKEHAPGMVGHTFGEVLSGIIIGGLFSTAFTYLYLSIGF